MKYTKKNFVKFNNTLQVKKIKDKYLNRYIDMRNLKINIKNSILKKKILEIDHYIWWFTNKNRVSYLVTKNNKELLVFYYSKFKINNDIFVIPGYFVSANKISIFDLLQAIKLQNEIINKLKGKKICIIIVPKNNFFSNAHTKYFGYKKLKKSEKIIKNLKKKIILKPNSNIYCRIANR